MSATMSFAQGCPDCRDGTLMVIVNDRWVCLRRQHTRCIPQVEGRISKLEDELERVTVRLEMLSNGDDADTEAERDALICQEEDLMRRVDYLERLQSHVPDLPPDAPDPGSLPLFASAPP